MPNTTTKDMVTKLQISLYDLIIATTVAAMFALVNSISYELGSGVVVRCFGIPLAYSKQVVSGQGLPETPTIIWEYAVYNAVVGILLIASAIFLSSTSRPKSSG